MERGRYREGASITALNLPVTAQARAEGVGVRRAAGFTLTPGHTFLVFLFSPNVSTE